MLINTKSSCFSPFAAPLITLPQHQLFTRQPRPPPASDKPTPPPRCRRTVPQPQAEQTRHPLRRTGQGDPSPGRAADLDGGGIRPASDRPGPSQGPGGESRTYHDQTPPAATADRQAGGEPTTTTGAPCRQSAGAEAGSTGTDTQAMPPARLIMHPPHPAGSRTAQERAKSPARSGRRKPTVAEKPPRARAEGRTAKPDEPRRQAERETTETLGSMADPLSLEI